MTRKTDQILEALEAQDGLALAAAALGRRGGAANTPAQRAQRAGPKPGAGRPREFPRCKACTAKRRTCYHLA